MAKVRHIKIENFRALTSFEWHPSSGINCLIGPGDSGKSTIIDAIDLCLGPRQAKVFADSDFHDLNTNEPIRIEITVGDLADALKSLDKYDFYLRGFDTKTGKIQDEPGDGLETALTVCLKVGADLDPIWSLYSDRAAAADKERNLTWGDRELLAGTRIGAVSEYHLTWRKGAVLNRLTDEKPDTSAAIAEAKRAARKAFGEKADHNLEETLAKVAEAADELGVPLEKDLQALLNAHSISLSGGTISLHDANGLPLSSLGLGSGRLLVAGLLNQAQVGSNLILVDELEHGLEPHRIIRFLGALGAKDPDHGSQAFITSHSPVVLRELGANQLFVLREYGDAHKALSAEIDGYSQGTIRRHAEAFLARSVLICEGASEVGLIRGLDLYRVENGGQSFFASGTALLDAGGYSKIYSHAPTLQSLGYRAASFRDDDVQPKELDEQSFLKNGGRVFKWAPEEKLEHAIIHGLPDEGVLAFVEAAVGLHGEDLVDQHIKSKSGDQCNLDAIRNVDTLFGFGAEEKNWLVAASTTKRNEWFKSIHEMEEMARGVIGPHFELCGADFRGMIESIFDWAGDG